MLGSILWELMLHQPSPQALGMISYLWLDLSRFATGTSAATRGNQP